MTVDIGGNIAALRKEKGVTQDELARFADVSVQAVSKWERGGMPDASLLPKIADFFNVTLDRLFGRVCEDRLTAVNTALKLIRETPSDAERVEIIHDLLWDVIPAAMGSNTAYPDYSLNEMADVIFSPWAYSMALTDKAVIMMSLAKTDSRYFFFAPEPPKGFGAVFPDVNEFAPFFDAMGREDFRRAFYVVHGGDFYERAFTSEFLANKLQIEPERGKEICGILTDLKLLIKSPLSMNADVIDVYKPHQNPAIIPLFCAVRDITRRPGSFFQHWDSREIPYLRQETGAEQ